MQYEQKIKELWEWWGRWSLDYFYSYHSYLEDTVHLIKFYGTRSYTSGFIRNENK